MVSLTSPRAIRASAFENFRSSSQKDFCNKIGTFRTRPSEFSTDAVETLAYSKADRTMSPIAEVMLAIRDRNRKPMR